MPGLFRLDIVCKIGRQGFARGAHRDLSEPPPPPQLPSRRSRRGQDAPWCYTEPLHSLQQSYLLPPRPPSPAPAIQNNITPSNIHEARCRRQGPLLQVAVTSVIAQYFPPQRKIVFIMCHEHRAKQSPT